MATHQTASWPCPAQRAWVLPHPAHCHHHHAWTAAQSCALASAPRAPSGRAPSTCCCQVPCLHRKGCSRLCCLRLPPPPGSRLRPGHAICTRRRFLQACGWHAWGEGGAALGVLWLCVMCIVGVTLLSAPHPSRAQPAVQLRPAPCCAQPAQVFHSTVCVPHRLPAPSCSVARHSSGPAHCCRRPPAQQGCLAHQRHCCCCCCWCARSRCACQQGTGCHSGPCRR